MSREFEGIDAHRCKALSELADQLLVKSLDIPLIGVKIFRCEFVEHGAENAADVVFENQLALLDALE